MKIPSGTASFFNPSSDAKLLAEHPVAYVFFCIIGIHIVATWFHQYLGHFFTAVCFTLGALMVAVSAAILY